MKSLSPTTSNPQPTTPLPPGSTIGILGAGQLGKMLAEAAPKLGYKTHVFAPDPDPIAAAAATHFTAGNYEDLNALQKFAASVDVITLEFENVPTTPLKTLNTPICPGAHVLEISQHRLREKNLAKQLGIGTAPFAPVTSKEELLAAVKHIGAPGILKTSTLGYDGKGQWKIENGSLPDVPFPGDYIYEGFVRFSKEISVIVARSASGEVKCFEPVENVHKNHILHTTTIPADITDAVAAKAIDIATRLANELKVVGLLAVEMFVTSDNDVLMNEIAPRPHNSGHWTLDACATSQFEQALRAVAGLPLGSTQRTSKAQMLNLIGDEVKDTQKYVQMPGARLHLYGKKEVRPGRKMGHVTFLERGAP